MRRKINTTQILTPDDKKYLRRISNYLNSIGMKDGNIEIDFNDGHGDIADINYNQITHFSNNYSAEIPLGLTQIVEKIMNYIDSEGLYNELDVDAVNYERLDIDIDTITKEISVNHWWSYYDKGDSNSIEFDSQEDLEQFDNWRSDEFSLLEIPESGILTLKYNGSGDSGYIENDFDETGDHVPAGVEDWCYKVLEDNYGGWEINEGSDGEFVFDFNNSMVTLNHTMNIESNDTDTIYEESFAE
jgi:hypothetical protein